MWLVKERQQYVAPATAQTHATCHGASCLRASDPLTIPKSPLNPTRACAQSVRIDYTHTARNVEKETGKPMSEHFLECASDGADDDATGPTFRMRISAWTTPAHATSMPLRARSAPQYRHTRAHSLPNAPAQLTHHCRMQAMRAPGQVHRNSVAIVSTHWFWHRCLTRAPHVRA